MNALYLILPIASDRDTANPELSFLKALNLQSADDVNTYLSKIYHAISYVAYEKFQTYYSQNKLKTLINEARRLSPSRKYPEAIKLLTLFNKKPFTAYSEREKVSALNINGSRIEDSIINRYLSSTGFNVLVDNEALVCNARELRILDEAGRPQQISLLQCDPLALYQWFVENRHPQRTLDANYRKHTKAPKNGYRGVISPLTYNKQETEYFLKRAVGVENEKNLFFKDAKNNKIIVFWNENLCNTPTYHAYEISVNDEGEIDKIYRKGGRSLVEKLNKHARK